MNKQKYRLSVRKDIFNWVIVQKKTLFGWKEIASFSTSNWGIKGAFDSAKDYLIELNKI